MAMYNRLYLAGLVPLQVLCLLWPHTPRRLSSAGRTRPALCLSSAGRTRPALYLLLPSLTRPPFALLPVQKYEFMPLLMTSIYGAAGVSVAWLRLYSHLATAPQASK